MWLCNGVLNRKINYSTKCEIVRRLGLQTEFAKKGHEKYMDPVFCFADNVRVKGHATYSACFRVTN